MLISRGDLVKEVLAPPDVLLQSSVKLHEGKDWRLQILEANIIPNQIGLVAITNCQLDHPYSSQSAILALESVNILQVVQRGFEYGGRLVATVVKIRTP